MSTAARNNLVTVTVLSFAAAIVERLCNTKAVAVPLVGYGSVNNIVVVRAGGRRVVVRLRESGGLAEYRKEEWCLTRAAEAGVPSPGVVDVGVVDSTAYMVLEFVEGVCGLVVVFLFVL